MSTPVPKQKKSRQNITRHTQEGIDVCMPNPPQTPPIQRSFFDLDSLCTQFLSDIFPLSPPQTDGGITVGTILAPTPGFRKAVLCFLHIIFRKGKQF